MISLAWVGFVSSSQEDDHFVTPPSQIDPIARTVVDPQLEDTLTHRLTITQHSKLDPSQPHIDASLRTRIPQGGKPLPVHVGLYERVHEKNVNRSSHYIKRQLFQTIQQTCAPLPV